MRQNSHFPTTKRDRERDIYRQANKKAKKEVARSKAHAMDEVYRPTRNWKHRRKNERSIEYQWRETNLRKISRR